MTETSQPQAPTPINQPTQKETILRLLDAHLLEATKTPGALRCIKPQEPIELAVGLYFNCPRCLGLKGVQHGITLLFDLPHVPVTMKPHGHFFVIGNDVRISHLSLAGVVESPTECGWTGVIANGKVWTNV